MSDPLRTDAARAADALSSLERDARIEQLLLQGLDAYFAGAYESAIHVWTRVLFLDRGHDRARAYIERARSAQAERQRESEELLHRGVAAFDRGETTSARSLLSAAASQGASPEVALSYLERLQRLDAPARPAAAVGRPGDPHSTPRPLTPAREGGARPWRFYTLAVVSVLAVSLAAWAGLVLFELADIRAALQRAPAAAPATRASADEAVPVPRQADIILARARAQYRAGHVIDALRLLDTIRPFDPAEGEADRLRVEIQQALGIVPAPAPAGAAPGGTPADPLP
jgi:cytochrome c-type biogenesis protein CcmH/NrfG